MEDSVEGAEGREKKLEALLRQKIESDPAAKAIIEALKANTGTDEREMLEQMVKAMMETGVAAQLTEMPSDRLCHLVQETWDNVCCLPGSRAR